jgi:hypothetical protein
MCNITEHVKSSLDSSVNIVTRLRAGRSGLDSRKGLGNLCHRFHTCSVAHTVSYPMGTGGSYPRVKLLGHEGDHSPPTSKCER